jgi:16S rRNA (uracil1498-N3)-methyltransferase
MRRFYIDKLDANYPVVSLKGAEARHLKNVLRLSTGDSVVLFDGRGVEYEAVIQDMSAGIARLSITRKYSISAESPLQIMVAQAFLKEKKMDELLRQLCELGMTHWIPFFSERSVPMPDKNRLAARIERWHKITVASLKQCRRTVLPEITVAMSMQEALTWGTSCDLRYIFWENEPSSAPATIRHQPDKAVESVLIMLGPEGGFAGHEVDQARTMGFVVAGLGPRILRAETAAVAACTLMQHLYGDMK